MLLNARIQSFLLEFVKCKEYFGIAKSEKLEERTLNELKLVILNFIFCSENLNDEKNYLFNLL